MASIFLKPKCANNRSKNTSNIVIITPNSRGIPNNSFNATALQLSQQYL